MCLTPIIMNNPYFHTGSKGLNYLHNTHNSKIAVPCGKCLQCLSNRQGFFNQRVQMESLRSHIFMLTLTYCDDAMPLIDCCGYNHPFPDFSDVTNMIKRIRSKGYKFRYAFVSEYGKKTHRPHFHALIAVEKSDLHWSIIEQTFSRLFAEEWKYNIGNRNNVFYKPLFYFARRGRKCNFDFHRIEHVPNHDNDTAYYVSKYLMKPDKHIQSLLHKIKYDVSLPEGVSDTFERLLKPRSVVSKDFGSWDYPLISSYIVDNLKFYKDIPQFVDLYSGKTMMLSPYYVKHLVPLSFRVAQFNNSSGRLIKRSVLDYRHFVRHFNDIKSGDLKPKYNLVLSPSFVVDDDRCVIDYSHQSMRAKRNEEKLKKIRDLIQYD